MQRADLAVDEGLGGALIAHQLEQPRQFSRREMGSDPDVLAHYLVQVALLGDRLAGALIDDLLRLRNRLALRLCALRHACCRSTRKGALGNFLNDAVDAGLRRGSDDLVADLAQNGDGLRADEAGAADHDDLHGLPSLVDA